MTEHKGKPKMFKAPVTLTMKLEEELHKELIEFARGRGVSVSAVVRWAILSYFEEGKKYEKH